MRPEDKRALVADPQARGHRAAVAAGVPCPVFGVLLTPIAAAAMSLSSVSVIGNALRLNRLRL